ncbi:hypothetical protein GCM10008939_23470 [Deinococcus aquiradiocola]|uniref:Uncharacterized protein n=2 Tax=Deinococcus aquiradiocola TaxID=393059 RepID=A0A917PI18_9DEIO|nr:hypothetical protein GCM10008939_23470 [Deinococcus aquiradiocola]
MLPVLLACATLLSLGAALLLTDRPRAAAATWAAGAGVTCWLTPAYLAWHTRHPAGPIGTFLVAHGLSTALLTAAVLLIAAGVWTLSHATACITLPPSPVRPALQFVSQSGVLLLPVAACLHDPRALPACFVLWSAGLAASLYFAVLYRHFPFRTPAVPSLQERRAIAAALLWLAFLGVPAQLWPTPTIPSCDLGRVVRLRLEGVRPGPRVMHDDVHTIPAPGAKRGLRADLEGVQGR